VMRENNPQLKQLVDEFVKSHSAETSFGNTLLVRCVKNTKVGQRLDLPRKRWTGFCVAIKQKRAAPTQWEEVGPEEDAQTTQACGIRPAALLCIYSIHRILPPARSDGSASPSGRWFGKRLRVKHMWVRSRCSAKGPSKRSKECNSRPPLEATT
jgi:hypothetical protein